MCIDKRQFGTHLGKAVTAYTLDNQNGLSAEILDLGGIIRKLTFRGTDVVLGRDSVEDYLCDNSYYGAIIGRNANRIEDCEFELNSKIYKLARNDNMRNNNLHGGKVGFNKRVWDSKLIKGPEPQHVLSLFSPDMEEGFPGNLNVTVTYTITRENSLKIHYEATTDSDTVLNMTNHSYFNLNGHASGEIKNHTLWIDSNFYTPCKENRVPDGRILSLLGTPLDFRSPKTISQDMDLDNPLLSELYGYDHTFVLNGRGFRKFASLTGDISGISMDCYTDLPAVQLYSGYYISEQAPSKENAHYSHYQGLCLETGLFPNAMRYPHFPSPILRKNEKYDTITEYKFSIGE